MQETGIETVPRACRVYRVHMMMVGEGDPALPEHGGAAAPQLEYDRLHACITEPLENLGCVLFAGHRERFLLVGEKNVDLPHRLHRARIAQPGLVPADV